LRSEAEKRVHVGGEENPREGEESGGRMGTSRVENERRRVWSRHRWGENRERKKGEQSMQVGGEKGRERDSVRERHCVTLVLCVALKREDMSR
jgi:hypothetical protein